MIKRGSEWRKWDLHIHTPNSIIQHYGNSDATWEKFINALENLPREVEVIGITDYYFIDGYERVMEYRNNGRLKNIKKIFPILEFRIDTFASASENNFQKINLHILFDLDEDNLEKEIDLVKREFILQIHLTKLDKHSTKSLTKENMAEEAGDLKKGFANLIPSTDEVLKIIKSSAWKEKTFLFLGYKEWSNLEKNQQLKPFKGDLYDEAHAFFSNGIDTNSKNQLWLNEYGNKRLLHSLDIHGFDLLDTYELDSNGGKLPIKNYTCHTWIKADPTFQGLKQIIYEPEERVKIQAEMPESEKLDNLMIEKVTFTSSQNRFTTESIYFGKSLNVIIGGKSSGKSILLYEIARTLYANTKDGVLRFKDAENEGKEKDLYNLAEISGQQDDQDYNFCVELYSKSKQNKKDRQNHSSILPGVKYIPQNHLSNLVDKSRKNGATLKKLIRDLILEAPECKSKYDDFIAQLKKNDLQRNQDIDFYYSLKEGLSKQKGELLSQGDIKALIEGISFNKKKIEQLNKDFPQEKQAQYVDLIGKLSQLKIKDNQVYADFDKLYDLQTDANRLLAELSNIMKIKIDSLQTERIKVEYSNKFKFVNEAIEHISDIAKQLIRLENGDFIEGSYFADEMQKNTLEREEITQQLQPFNERVENQKQISSLQKSIEDDEGKIASIEQFKKEIEAMEKEIISCKEKIFRDFQDNFNLYGKLIDDLEPRINEVQSSTDEIEILPSTKYQYPAFRKLVDDIFDRRSFDARDFEYLYQDLDKSPKSALADVDYGEIKKSLECIFDGIESKKLSPKGRNTERDAVQKIFTDYFFDHWDVKSQGDDIHKMSTGKASFVLLKLIIKLSRENGPILIDQPEDNLDNRSVSRELVDFLKEKKRERQIILVTHNPNIVVNADAENIIVANQKGQNDGEHTSDFKFDYINGALEDSFTKNESIDVLKSMGIREHVAEVVEGGEDAFKKREEKYGFRS